MQESGQWSERGVVNMVTLAWSVLDQSNPTLCSDSYEPDGWLCTDFVWRCGKPKMMFYFSLVLSVFKTLILYYSFAYGFPLFYFFVMLILLMLQFNSVAQSCLTLWDPVACRTLGFRVHHQLQGLLKLMSIESVMPSNHLSLCRPLLLCLQSRLS